jgi:sirohydrochlorin ferrochelatase
MNALLIVAHGSRKKESNDEVIQLARDLDAIEESPFDRVLCAFNQFSGPTVDDQIAELAGQGITDITVLPYFIAAGSHVVTDIPERVDQARERYPAIRFNLAQHLGAFTGIKRLILEAFSGR